MVKLNGWLAIGVLLVIFGAFQSLATVVVDDTPPVINENLTVPRDGDVLSSLSTITCAAEDPESGVKSVTCRIVGESIDVTYSLWKGPTGRWTYQGDPGLFPAGDYSFTFTATNNADLKSSYVGSFTIYTDLMGIWKINDVVIENSSQVVYSTSRTITFEFQKTAGVSDDKISAWVESGSQRIVDMALVDEQNHIWKGSKLFEYGKHNVTLKASDSYMNIQFAMVQLGLSEQEYTPPESPTLPTEPPQISMPTEVGGVPYGWIIMVAGVALIVLGAKKGRKKELLQ